MLEGVRNELQGCVFALTGKASDAIDMISAGIAACAINGSNTVVPLYLSYLARAYADLGQFDEAWRCIGEAMSMIETTKERWFEAEVNRDRRRNRASSRRSRIRRKHKHISSARWPSRGSSKQSPGNCARR